MDTVFSPEETAVLTFAIVALNGWNRLAVGLGSNVLGLDGLDLPGQAGGASSYLVIPEAAASGTSLLEQRGSLTAGGYLAR